MFLKHKGMDNIKLVSAQSRQAGIACERIAIRQDTRLQFPEKMENYCMKSVILWPYQVMNRSQIAYQKCGLFF
jgi:hypothetical protein